MRGEDRLCLRYCLTHKATATHIIRKWLFYMVAPGRFERPAYRLGGGRSIQLSYGARTGRTSKN